MCKKKCNFAEDLVKWSMKTRSNHTDLDLLAGIIEGSNVAFTELYERYYDVLYMIALKYLKDEETTKDAIQQVFLWLWENRAELAPNTDLRKYLCTMTKHQVINIIQRDNLTIQKYYQWAQIRQQDDNWLEKIESEGRWQQLEAAIDALPEQKRKICHLKLDKHLSNQEIADYLGVSVQTVKNLYSSAIKMLKEQEMQKKTTFFKIK